MHVEEGIIDAVYGAAQVILMGLSYASINISQTYIDLSAPILFGLGSFIASRIYLVYARKKDIRHIWEKRFITPGAISIGLISLTNEKVPGTFGRSLRKAIKKYLKGKNIFVEKLRGNENGIKYTFGDLYFIYSILGKANSQFTKKDLDEIASSLLGRKKLNIDYSLDAELITFSEDKTDNIHKWRKSILNQLRTVYRNENDEQIQ